MRVRITEHPRERDVDGVSLERMKPGTVCDVSPTVGTWLVVQGYAYPEMRRTPEELGFEKDERPRRHERRHR